MSFGNAAEYNVSATKKRIYVTIQRSNNSSDSNVLSVAEATLFVFRDRKPNTSSDLNAPCKVLVGSAEHLALIQAVTDNLAEKDTPIRSHEEWIREAVEIVQVNEFADKFDVGEFLSFMEGVGWGQQR